MKHLIRHVLFSAISLYVLSWMFKQVAITDIRTLLLTAIVLSLFMVVVKPIFQVLLLPVNLITFGLFSWIIHIIILFMVDWLVPGFQVGEIMIPALNILGISIPAILLSRFWSLLLVSLAVSFGNSLLGSLL